MDLRWRPLWAGSWLRWSLVRRCRMMWSLLGCHGLQALKAHCRISVLADHAVLVLSMVWFAQALKTPWKFENCWISVKSPWIFHRSPWMFLKVPWIKITFVLKKHVLRKGMIESTAIHKFSLVNMKSLFLWSRCSWHGSFSVIWRTLLTVPCWRKLLQ